MHLYAAAFLMSTNSRGSESSTKRCTNNVPKIQIKEHGHGPFFPFFILFQCFFHPARNRNVAKRRCNPYARF